MALLFRDTAAMLPLRWIRKIRQGRERKLPVLREGVTAHSYGACGALLVLHSPKTRQGDPQPGLTPG